MTDVIHQPETEHGFFHPSIGYWQTSSLPSEELFAAYPEGTIPYPLKPGENYEPQDGGWVYVEPSTEPPEGLVQVIWAVHFWERMTHEEAEAVGAEMDKQDFRTRMIFSTASSFRSDHALWPVLQSLAATLFPPDRVAAILSPSEFVAP